MPIRNLRELRDQSTAISDTPARLSPGDRLQISVEIGGTMLDLNVGIVGRPVLAPPAASYGLATCQGAAVSSALFATAPPPQVIDFPDLAGDLKAGHVRRRALFLWRFVYLSPPAKGNPFAFLVKLDRAGGGQLPESRADFEGYGD
ncbi:MULTISPECIES: hypothetical protein [unclassified Caballeronia]|uniref:hypothetical protein n=1 Tax=unclassified Caballeronia TaxID=2646786 RepID=UPI00285901B4|nr:MULTISPECIES: hypothetical protein [unclassified Caballeronia]MDR5752227.1 hypothetical protein [Caballeronia sp. LZ024]MDR5841744.1 hypothetical protein [Caballeronia sp. LZ031]